MACVMVSTGCQLNRLQNGGIYPPWVCLRGSLQAGLTEVRRPALNVVSPIQTLGSWTESKGECEMSIGIHLSASGLSVPCDLVPHASAGMLSPS